METGKPAGNWLAPKSMEELVDIQKTLEKNGEPCGNVCTLEGLEETGEQWRARGK